MIEMGDRVRVVLANGSIKTTRDKILNGATGTVKDIHRFFSTGIEFDDDIGGSAGRWGGKDGHCWYVDNECLENIEESEVKEMNDLEIGDRVRVVDDPIITRPTGYEVMAGIEGTVKELDEMSAGVEFDDYMSGHNGSWNWNPGHCWHIPYESLEKIEDTEKETKEEIKEETKAETMEQKILEVLREEISVEVGEEFDVYENGEKQWTCKFEENGFYRITDESSYESGIWKNIIGKFHKYKFKKKPFIPQEYEHYWHVDIRCSGNLEKSLDVSESVWVGILFDYGMLALGNVFRSKEEALKGEDKLLERLNELLKGE